MMKTPFRFLCMTDDAEGLAQEIEVVKSPPFAMEESNWHQGMWPKLCAFAPGLFTPDPPVIMMDVDVVILRDLTPLFDHLATVGGLHIFKEIPDTLPRTFPKLFGKELKSNSSVVGFVAGTQDHLYLDSHDKSFTELRQFRNDQDYIHYHATDRHSWPIGWMLSLKKPRLSFSSQSGATNWPTRRLRCHFHGKPDPDEMTKGPFKRWGSPEKFSYFPVR